jgi:hypothetical protein
MCRIETFAPPESREPLHAAVIDLLVLAVPQPAALGEPDAEAKALLETLRRIVARSADEAPDEAAEPRADMTRR